MTIEMVRCCYCQDCCDQQSLVLLGVLGGVDREKQLEEEDSFRWWWGYLPATSGGKLS